MDDTFRLSLQVYIQTIHHDENGHDIPSAAGGITAWYFIDVPACNLTDAIKALVKFQELADGLKASYPDKST